MSSGFAAFYRKSEIIFRPLVGGGLFVTAARRRTIPNGVSHSAFTGRLIATRRLAATTEEED